MPNYNRFSRLTAPMFSAVIAVGSALLPPAATLHAAEGEVVRQVLFAQGSLVPGAGVFGSGIPQRALWTGFGTPAISDGSLNPFAGEIAFLGRWAADGEKEKGIFVSTFNGANARLRVKSGEELRGVGRFVSFREPQIASDGGVLFFATVQGPSVTAANATVVCYSAGPDNEPELIARAGAPVPGHREILATIGSAALARGGNVALRGVLARGGQTTDANDQAAFTWKTGTPVLDFALREGEQIAGLGRVKSFTTLVNNPSAPGAGVGWFFTRADGLTHLNARADFTNGISRVMSIRGAFKTSLASAGVPRPGFLPDFRSLALPSFSEFGDPRAAYRAVTHLGRTGIFHLNPANEFNTSVAHVGQDAPQIVGKKILSLGNPVVAPGDSLWFAGIGKTAVEPGRALYRATPGGESVRLIAREGAQAVGAEPGERWKRFTSIANPGGAGPLFTASIMDGGVIASEDEGLWGVDSVGQVRLLLREGDKLNGQTVRSFQVLRASIGSAGVARSYNYVGHVVILVFFKNGATALARIEVPRVEPQ